MAAEGEERHEHELLTEWYRHSHDGGGEPHEHEHTPEEAAAHEEAAGHDIPEGMSEPAECPVCGVIHELAPDVQEELEQEEEPTAEEEPEPAHEEAEEVTGAPPQDEDEPGPRRRVVTSAWHAHRRK